jgi:hypothetical protein
MPTINMYNANVHVYLEDVAKITDEILTQLEELCYERWTSKSAKIIITPTNIVIH